MDGDGTEGMFELPEEFLRTAAAKKAAHSLEVEKVAAILCIDCGVAIKPNPTAMCVDCLRTKVDISEGIPKQAVVYFCKSCERYLKPPNIWVRCELESKELLALLLKKLKGLGKVHMIDAGFIWTEPHSRRLKVKLTIQKEVDRGAILQQVFVVEYVVHTQMCDDCHRVEAKDSWNCIVQLRQKVKHKKTFFFLEQLIIKHRAHREALNIKSRPDGVDFYFSSRTHGKRLIDFLQNTCPIRVKKSERLISQDIQSASFNYKFSFAVEIVPICKQDIVCLHPQSAKKYGGIRQIALCTNVGTSLHFMDVTNLQAIEISGDRYWEKPFNAVCTHKMLTEFVVLDTEDVDRRDYYEGTYGKKFKLVDATIARIRDFGVNDDTMLIRTHLGHLIHPGDNVWGFDCEHTNMNDEHVEKMKAGNMPQVVLVKKSFSERNKRARKRRWKLKTLTQMGEMSREDMTEKEIEAEEGQFEGFMQDIEEDPDMRGNINLYKNPDITTPDASMYGDDDSLAVRMEEMLDGFDEMDLAGPDEDDGEAGVITDDSVGGHSTQELSANQSLERPIPGGKKSKRWSEE